MSDNFVLPSTFRSYQVARQTELRSSIPDNDNSQDTQKRSEPAEEIAQPETAVVAKKRGRPSKKSSEKRDWDDDEIFVLIETSSNHDNLYNTRNSQYFNRDTRQKSLEKIQKELADQGIFAAVKDIADKLTNLKTYYGGQKRSVESSKASGAGADDVYESNWKFFQVLHFLNDSFTPRRTFSNADENSTYEVLNPPSAKSAKKIRDSSMETAQKVMHSAAAALEKLNEKRSNGGAERKEKTEDEVFCELLCKILTSIPNGEEKDMLKLNMQHSATSLKYKRRHSSSSSSSVSSSPLGSPVFMNNSYSSYNNGLFQ
ncbi:uncharacterized protein LOC130629986 [Hydractinia symbiolongicarpus]|uniref:uncharacterized protein LOC130629986 n=1 Tax=Hydractinia symbiolongicarpus TaxID=13093 RepID=UPI002549F326|nr:uncharacterized protein LOC130629986 [Hydractinia symbiolongicarpus]